MFPGSPSLPSPRFPSDGRLSLLATRLTILMRARWDRRRFLRLVAVAVLAIVVARLVTTSREVITGLGETRPVAVAATDLSPGAVVGPGDVRIERWPLGLIPEGSAPSELDVLGHGVRSTIMGGEAIVAHRIGLGRLGLNPDERAISLPMPLAPPPVEVGDDIELVAVGLDGAEFDESQLDGGIAELRAPEATATVRARHLGQARVVSLSEDAIAVAVHQTTVAVVLESLAVGTVEIVAGP